MDRKSDSEDELFMENRSPTVTSDRYSFQCDEILYCDCQVMTLGLVDSDVFCWFHRKLKKPVSQVACGNMTKNCQLVYCIMGQTKYDVKYLWIIGGLDLSRWGSPWTVTIHHRAHTHTHNQTDRQFGKANQLLSLKHGQNMATPQTQESHLTPVV